MRSSQNYLSQKQTHHAVELKVVSSSLKPRSVKKWEKSSDAAYWYRKSSYCQVLGLIKILIFSKNQNKRNFDLCRRVIYSIPIMPRNYALLACRKHKIYDLFIAPTFHRESARLSTLRTSNMAFRWRRSALAGRSFLNTFLSNHCWNEWGKPNCCLVAACDRFYMASCGV